MSSRKTQAKCLTELIENIDLAIFNTTTLNEINQTTTYFEGFEEFLKLNINQLNLFNK
jgi:hypothetical protein